MRGVIQNLQNLKARSESRSGAALLTVLIAMMIISIVLLELQHATMVERKLAYNELNQLQAYYLAKSGVRISLLRIALYARARKDPTIKAMVPANMDIKPYLEMIWNLPIPAFPPERGELKKMVKNDKDAAEKVLEETKISDGSFTAVISSEGSKINLNYLMAQDGATPPDPRTFFTPPATTLTQSVGLTLYNLLENFIKESEDPGQEFPNLKPDETVFDIMDWVNPGPTRFGGGSKDVYYDAQQPPYKAKRSRFYSLDELRLVKGIDEHLYNKLKPFVTVYSYDGKININSASHDLLKALYRDFTDDDLKRIDEEKGKRGGAWLKEQDFVDFIVNVLGRSGFKTAYNDPNNYPFTVANYSFIIESLGTVKKSKSQVQRIIKVGVALGGASNKPPPGTTQAACAQNAQWFWDTRLSPPVCAAKPLNNGACTDLAGRWDDSQKCCYLSNLPPLCAAPPNPAPTPAPGQPAQPGAPTPSPTPQPEPSTMKILYWTEN